MTTISPKKLGLRLKDLREQCSLSQDEMAQKIGLSRAAVSEIERGNRGVEAVELAKIADLFRLRIDAILRDEEPADVKKPALETPSQYNVKFDAQKLKNVILYILEKCGGKPNLGETVLYKLLYFIDFDSFEILGKPIIGLNYIRLQYGPVPTANEYNPVIKEMAENDVLKIFSQKYYGMLQKRYVALQSYEAGSLRSEENKIIDSVINRLSDMSATQIEAYVHEDIPWKITENGQIISYDLVIDREAPYAQKDYDKLWQDAAGADTIKELGPISKEERDYYSNL